MKTIEADREVAKISYVDFEIEDHGIPTWHVTFEGDGWGQGLGTYCAEISFMCRLMGAVGVYAMKDLKGKSVWITHTHDSILKVEPLYKKDGKPFVIEDWKKWVNERVAPMKISPHEYVTGKRP